MPALSAKQAYSRTEVRRVLDITERQLRSWEKEGYIPEGNSFGFNDLLALKTLVKLRQGRVSAPRIRQAMAALRERMIDVSNPLTELKIYAEGTRIRVDLDGQTMEPVSGQLLLDFGQTELAKLLEFPTVSKQAQETVSLRKKRLEAEMLFEKALTMEQTGAPIEEIIEVYEYALSLDPNSTGALVNLGTIHFNARDHKKAEEYYLKAIGIDPEYALAHFNLANLYDERREPASAQKHYLAALKLNPRYADAHYNIALLYQATGQTMRAVQHWQTYLKIDPSSSWATIARRELDKLKSATVLQGGA